MTTPSTQEPWGRLLITGGTDFATLGRRDKSGKNLSHPDRPDLVSVHIVRPVANIKFKKVISSHSASHGVAITIDDKAYLWGRNDHHQLTHPLPDILTAPTTSPEGVDSPTPAAPFPFPLNSLPDSNVPAKLKAQQIATAAVGRNHSILVTKSGEAWTAGWNNLGQCGQPKGEHASRFARVGGALLKEEVVAASAGISFSLFLTKAGTVYAVGTGEKGVLGNGRTGESIHASKVLFIEQDEPLLVGGALKDKNIIQITSGQYHSVALDDKGYCYAWGWGGLGRLGMGVQADCLVPTIIPSFAGAQALTRCAHISAGPACTLFIDKQGMTLLCGKWKNTGDGSSGQPWMMPKHVQDIQSIKVDRIAAGGVTLFCAKQRDKFDGDMLVGWGQSAIYGELGLGVGAVKSATKPIRLEAMNDIHLLDIAAGQNTTYFVARPPATDSAVAEAEKPSEEAEAEMAPAAAPEPAAAPAAAPGFDLSGFGFDFGPPKAASPAPAAPLVPAAPVDTGLSRTKAEAWEAFERYPPVYDVPDQCQVCGGDDPEFEALECEMCENAWHCKCLTPALPGPPEGEWFCPRCAIADEVSASKPVASSKKRPLDDGADSARKR